MLRYFVTAFLICFGAAQAQNRDSGGWVPYTNERFGFSLQYPADTFELERTAEAGDGQVFTGRRGHGRLLIGAFLNSDGHTVEGYQRYIARESYSHFKILYAPRGQTWFVLSGQDSENIFYEKVMFTCGGSVINSFALIYPASSKSRFNPIVEGIEKTFRAGQDCTQHARR